MTTPTYTDYLELVATPGIRPVDIRTAAEANGLTHCAILWANDETGDARIILWQVGDVQAIETNGDSIWRESDEDAFLLALAQAGHPDSRYEVEDRDIPRTWELREGGHMYRTVHDATVEDARDAARGAADTGDYGDRTATQWTDVSLSCVETGEHERVTVTIEPTEPACVDTSGHDWQSPIELVGGIESNPGVFASGGGVRIHEACMRCGCGRVTDTWAQRPDTGEQGLTSVSYKPQEYDLDKLGYVIEEQLTPIRDGYIIDGPADVACVTCEQCMTASERARAEADEQPHMGWIRAVSEDDEENETCDRCGARVDGQDVWRWVVVDRTHTTYTVATDEDDAREIAYQCRAGHAMRYTWADAQ